MYNILATGKNNIKVQICATYFGYQHIKNLKGGMTYDDGTKKKWI